MHQRIKSDLMMVMDEAMVNRLDGIRRSYQALTERLGDPDVIADSNLLMKVMSDRSKSEDVVTAFEEVSNFSQHIFFRDAAMWVSLEICTIHHWR